MSNLWPAFKDLYLDVMKSRKTVQNFAESCIIYSLTHIPENCLIWNIWKHVCLYCHLKLILVFGNEVKTVRGRECWHMHSFSSETINCMHAVMQYVKTELGWFQNQSISDFSQMFLVFKIDLLIFFLQKLLIHKWDIYSTL